MLPTPWWAASWVTGWWGKGAAWAAASLVGRWRDGVAAAWVAGLLLGLPFLTNDQLGLLLFGGVGLVLGLWFVEPPAGIWGTAVLYWVTLTLATAFSPVKMAALSGWVKASLYLMSLAVLLRGVRRWGQGLMVVYLLVGLLVAVVGLRQWFFGAAALATWIDPESPLAGTTRVYSFLKNPNLLAAYLLPGVGMSLGCLWAWRTWAQRGLALTLVLVLTACVVLTGSRGGWLGLAAVYASFAVGLGWGWWQWRWQRPLWQRILLWLGMGLLLVALLALLGRSEWLRLRFLSIFAGRADSSNNFRLTVWAAVVAMIRDHPWLGIGPGNRAFNLIYPLYQRPNFAALGAYSVPLEVAVESGLLGLAAFVALTGSILQRSWQTLSQKMRHPCPQTFVLLGVLAGMVGTMTHGLVDTLWFRPQVQLLWWFSVALVCQTYASKSSP
ncbi:IctB family putative bicarbonate transporter [Gloeomargarita sp.]